MFIGIGHNETGDLVAEYIIRLILTHSVTGQRVYPVWCWVVPLWNLEREIERAYAYGMKWYKHSNCFHGLTIYRSG